MSFIMTIKNCLKVHDFRKKEKQEMGRRMFMGKREYQIHFQGLRNLKSEKGERKF